MGTSIILFLLVGIPEFDFPTLDPLFYKGGQIIFSSGELRGIILLILSNLNAIGLAKTNFTDVEYIILMTSFVWKLTHK